MASSTADITPDRGRLAKNAPDTRTAVEAGAETASWSVVSSSAGDALYVAFVDHARQTYTLLKDNAGTLLLFDEHEWACFVDGVRNHEF